jgi:hypothetical protein
MLRKLGLQLPPHRQRQQEKERERAELLKGLT